MIHLNKSDEDIKQCYKPSLTINDLEEDTVIDIAEEHPLIKHSIQINRTRRSNLYLLCMLFIFLFIILPFIVFFESTKNNENLNKLRIK
jgi:hypothetical protein